MMRGIIGQELQIDFTRFRKLTGVMEFKCGAENLRRRWLLCGLIRAL